LTAKTGYIALHAYCSQIYPLLHGTYDQLSRSGKSGVDSRGGICRSGKCTSDNGWKVVRKEKKSRTYKPIRYQQLEQSMIGYCDNYCKDTKAVSE